MHTIQRRDIQDDVKKGLLHGKGATLQSRKRGVYVQSALYCLDAGSVDLMLAEVVAGRQGGCGFIFDITLSRRASPLALPAGNAFTLTKDNKGCV